MGKLSRCLSTSAAAVSSSSTESATTLAPASASASLARENDASCALQYGHQEPRYTSTMPYEPTRSSGREIVPPPTAGTEKDGNCCPLMSRGTGILAFRSGLVGPPSRHK